MSRACGHGKGQAAGGPRRVPLRAARRRGAGVRLPIARGCGHQRRARRQHALDRHRIEAAETPPRVLRARRGPPRSRPRLWQRMGRCTPAAAHRQALALPVALVRLNRQDSTGADAESVTRGLWIRLKTFTAGDPADLHSAVGPDFVAVLQEDALGVERRVRVPPRRGRRGRRRRCQQAQHQRLTSTARRPRSACAAAHVSAQWVIVLPPEQIFLNKILAAKHSGNHMMFTNALPPGLASLAGSCEGPCRPQQHAQPQHRRARAATTQAGARAPAQGAGTTLLSGSGAPTLQDGRAACASSGASAPTASVRQKPTAAPAAASPSTSPSGGRRPPCARAPRRARWFGRVPGARQGCPTGTAGSRHHKLPIWQAAQVPSI